ncbi:hypothetical protein AVEN_207663-1 [Araneus ventricosus]|uniref:Uncharacterized protein n=1 Tax=Araneus ventricosus TaxID=182803 RepID=A0A4Y2KWH6_ARAVE|nr:hypothetical protein AVEN_207663-1 [Araneus ventricosus]
MSRLSPFGAGILPIRLCVTDFVPVENLARKADPSEDQPWFWIGSFGLLDCSCVGTSRGYVKVSMLFCISGYPQIISEGKLVNNFGSGKLFEKTLSNRSN